MNKYTGNVDGIKPGNKLHERIKRFVNDRAKYSDDETTKFSDRWDRADETFTAYLKESDEAWKRRDEKDMMGKLDYVTLEVPYSFAIISTLHTYFASVFLSRTPIIQLTGRHGEPQDNIMAMEAYLDYQLRVGGSIAPLFNWLFDQAKYGVGILAGYWAEEFANVSRYELQQEEIAGVEIEGKTKKVLVAERLLKYMGNKFFNVRPYDFIRDPRRSLANFQQGEFAGRRFNMAAHELYAGDYANVAEAMGSPASNSDDIRGSFTVERPEQPGETSVSGRSLSGTPDYMKAVELYARVVPKMLGLSEVEYPEIWKFTVINKSIVIEAKPQGLYHDMFPYFVQTSQFGYAESVHMNHMDYMRPLSDSLTWLFNSHMYSVRTALNDKRVVDPSRVVMSDVTDLRKNVIRLKPDGYGTDARTAVHQLRVADPTSQNLASAQYVEQMLQRVSGVVDNMMGMVNTSGRKTATEVRSTQSMAGNRHKVLAEYNSALGWSELTQMMVQNSLQLMPEEVKISIAGNIREESEVLTLQPDRIAGFYDWVPVDGTMPVDRLAQANFWKELLTIMASSEQLGMSWDINRIVSHIMKMQGERNIDRFQIQVRPDQALMQQAEAGNVVPISGGAGQGSPGGVL